MAFLSGALKDAQRFWANKVLRRNRTSELEQPPTTQNNTYANRVLVRRRFSSLNPTAGVAAPPVAAVASPQRLFGASAADRHIATAALRVQLTQNFCCTPEVRAVVGVFAFFAAVAAEKNALLVRQRVAHAL